LQHEVVPRTNQGARRLHLHRARIRQLH
jgi:hypothetical protein